MTTSFTTIYQHRTEKRPAIIKWPLIGMITYRKGFDRSKAPIYCPKYEAVEDLKAFMEKNKIPGADVIYTETIEDAQELLAEMNIKQCNH